MLQIHIFSDCIKFFLYRILDVVNIDRIPLHLNFLGSCFCLRKNDIQDQIDQYTDAPIIARV